MCGPPPPVLAFHAKELKQGLEAVSEAAGSTVDRSRAVASGARLLRFRSHAKAVARSASGAATAFRPERRLVGVDEGDRIHKAAVRARLRPAAR